MPHETSIPQQASPYQFLADAAHAYLGAGRSVGPIEPHTKYPKGNAWKIHQQQRPSTHQIHQWFDGRHPMGLCLFCGKVSGDLELIDFDEFTTYQTFVDLVNQVGYAALLDRLVIEYTPRPGVHLGYCCEVIQGNTKLARQNIGVLPNGRDEIKTLIETRGEGGLAVVAPTPAGIHPDCPERGYALIQGDWTRPPRITPDEREILWNCARALNRYEKSASHTYGEPKTDQDRVGSHYNEHIPQKDILSLLEIHGWTKVYAMGEAEYLRRPGKSQGGWSATLGSLAPKRLYVFSTNADPFENDRSYDPFGIYARLEHGGDFRAATKALVDLGYGRNGQPPRGPYTVEEEEQHTTEDPTIRGQTPDEGPPQALGGVQARADGYYRKRIIKESPIYTKISSFTVRPTLRIWVDGSEAVRAQICCGKNLLGEVTIERHCWHSRGAFLKVLPSLDQWCVATDNEIQAIQALVASHKVPSKRGTRMLGLVDGVWVSDEGIFDASGWIQDPDLGAV